MASTEVIIVAVIFLLLIVAAAFFILDYFKHKSKDAKTDEGVPVWIRSPDGRYLDMQDNPDNFRLVYERPQVTPFVSYMNQGEFLLPFHQRSMAREHEGIILDPSVWIPILDLKEVIRYRDKFFEVEKSIYDRVYLKQWHEDKIQMIRMELRSGESKIEIFTIEDEDSNPVEVCCATETKEGDLQVCHLCKVGPGEKKE